jgi:DNA-directed RNA polymerase subunit RPC12/RpoP
MSSFFDKIRSGAGKAAFEADKLRRVTAIQATIRTHKGNFDKVLVEAGQVAFALHQTDQITQPELQKVCERLAAVQKQIREKEQEIERIRAEEYVESQEAGRVCPNGHGPLPAQDNFCQVCGASAVEVSPPTTAGLACPNCGVALASGARFCSSCGQTVVLPESTQPQTPQTDTCESCGAELLPDSIFCAECGHKVAQPEEEFAPAEMSDWPEQLEVDEMTETEIETPWPSIPVSVTETSQMDETLEAEDNQTQERDALVADIFQETDQPTQLEQLQTEDDGLIMGEDTPAGEVDETEAVTDKCPSCDAQLLPEAVFCAECGHRLT